MIIEVGRRGCNNGSDSIKKNSNNINSSIKNSNNNKTDLNSNSNNGKSSNSNSNNNNVNGDFVIIGSTSSQILSNSKNSSSSSNSNPMGPLLECRPAEGYLCPKKLHFNGLCLCPDTGAAGNLVPKGSSFSGLSRS